MTCLITDIIFVPDGAKWSVQSSSVYTGNVASFLPSYTVDRKIARDFDRLFISELDAQYAWLQVDLGNRLKVGGGI